MSHVSEAIYERVHSRRLIMGCFCDILVYVYVYCMHE